MPDYKNINLGPCNVMLDDVDIGFTKGGVSISVETATRKVSFDNFKKVVKKEFISDRTAEVKFSLSETTFQNLKKALPAANYNFDPQTTAENVAVFTGLGKDVANIDWVVLRLRPLGATDDSNDILFPKSYLTGNLDFSVKYDEERLFPLTFNAINDDETGILFIVGNLLASFDGILSEDKEYLFTTDGSVLILEESSVH